MNYEIKHRKLLNKAKKYMKSIKDPEHDINHMIDVVKYTKELIKKIECDKEVSIIAAYYHDVGRTIKNEGHEEESVNILKNEMKRLGYDQEIIGKCEEAIKYHKWNMNPTTIEGLIIKDADKLGFIGINRWKSAKKNGIELTEIKRLLPRLRNEILYFDESKKIYDRDIKRMNKVL